MKKQDGTQDIHDSDLQQLFRKQGQPPSPEDLDLRLLSAAAEAVKPERSAPPPGRPPAVKAWRTGFAVAALVMLSVTIVPMLPRYQNTELAPVISDDSDTRRSESSISDNAAMAITASDQAESMAAMPAMPAVQNIAEKPQSGMASFSASPKSAIANSGQGVDLTESVSRMKKSATSAESVLRQTDASEEIDALSEASPASDGFGYRDYPESWISYIRVLEKDGRRAEARREKELFDKAFPNYKQTEPQ